jgi:hypothetical protein
MADYVATLISVSVPTQTGFEQHNSNLVCTVRFDNGVRVSTRQFVATDLDRGLRAECVKAIKDLRAQDATLAAMAPAIGLPIKLG